MPNIIFNNLEEKNVKKISKEITKELSDVVGSPEDWFTFTYQPSQVFIKGESDKIVFVTVNWFKRSKEVQDKVADIIQNSVINITSGEVAVVFQHLDEDNYYEK